MIDNLVDKAIQIYQKKNFDIVTNYFINLGISVINTYKCVTETIKISNSI